MTIEEAADRLAKLPEVKNVEIASLNPGDVVVFSCDTAVSQDMAQRMEACVQPIFPNNKILILDRGVTMTVARS